MSFFRIAVLLVLALVLSSCGLVKAFIPDQDLGDTVLKIDAKEVPLQTQRRKVVTSSSLAPQQEDADCTKTLELPAGCEIFAVTPTDENTVFKFNDQKNEIPNGLEPNLIITQIGLKPKLLVMVPALVDETTLPQKLTLSQFKVTLKLFDADLKADQVATAKADIEKTVESKEGATIVFARTSDPCKAVTVEKQQFKQCGYGAETTTEDILEIRFTEIQKLIEVIAIGKGKSSVNTLAGSAELHFPKLEGGNLPQQGVFMVIKLDEGKSIAKFR